ncbi:aspartate aminotransferase family protein [Flammeovirga yaeyamensis]|uniref:Aspartate aminotransferase family protein n=1 Tax=Flammeovirga yaeyamensis TaxID=367791 RepID=A0AAX1N6H4_9BACT|nr:aspartate aminotransferase family protein [Flammeovirga yaeyamensis]MBB3698221.1 L-2,4-diaminobutyrate decarboxylase [Flammeovirga yaeyamensis]NMF34424.1 aspartate aminotransferase family protein [Flammeovirga yaeyamensis]QWG01403.1 aspartate aminotransferase family protein [Flammeovirga yaeyamensis]
MFNTATEQTQTVKLDLSFLFSQDPESRLRYIQDIGKATDRVLGFLKDRTKPFSGVQPNDLKPLFEKINLNDEPQPLEEVLDELKHLYLDHAVAFHLPKYIAHLNCPVVVPSLVGEQIIAAINSSLDTWDQSAGGTLIEQKLIDWTAKEIGFEKGDGVFTSGGTQSNLMAALLMRDAFTYKNLNHDIDIEGLPKEKLKIFCSEHSHFSTKKSAAILGLGQDAVISIPTDENFKMKVDELESAILQTLIRGEFPIGVVATAGTTDYGSIDPIHQIADIASRYQIWLHVDAAIGGGLLLSSEYKYMLDGINKADSVTVDYHKTFFQTVSCSAFVVNDPNVLSLISHHADYLNPKDQKKEGYPNQVDKSLQTTKRFDALKLWLTLRNMGKEQLGAYYDKTIELTKIAAKLIDEHASFKLMNPPNLNCLVFRFERDEIDDIHWNNLNKDIRKALFYNGEAMVAATKFKGNNYLKFTILNPSMTSKDFEEILSLLEGLGYELMNKLEYKIK